MSIHDQIQTLVDGKRLCCLESEMLGDEDETPRTIFLSEEVRQAVHGPFTEDVAVLHAEFRQHLDAFIEHGFITVGDDPDTKESYAMMARVRPVERDFFDVRVTTPQPQIRAFGGFVGQNVLVLVTWNYRETIDDDFNGEVARCIDEWVSLFGSTPPFKGNSLGDYLTNFDSV